MQIQIEANCAHWSSTQSTQQPITKKHEAERDLARVIYKLPQHCNRYAAIKMPADPFRGVKVKDKPIRILNTGPIGNCS
jgi:hypothetical protein